MNPESLVEKYLGITNYHTEKIPLPPPILSAGCHLFQFFVDYGFHFGKSFEFLREMVSILAGVSLTHLCC